MKNKHLLRSFFFIFSILLTNGAIAQDNKLCRVLTAVLKDDLCRRTFKLDLYPETPVVIIDKKGLVKDCPQERRYNKDVKILFDTAYKKQHRSMDIIIYNIEETKKKYKVYVEQTGTGAVGFIELKKPKLKITNFAIGYF